jgi:hypothetical protein
MKEEKQVVAVSFNLIGSMIRVHQRFQAKSGSGRLNDAC